VNRISLLIRWGKILAGRSYFHIPQGLGKVFEPETLHGYFNDLTGKTHWAGLVDGGGIPMVQLIDGSTSYFSTTIIQKALGHHDRYLIMESQDDFDEFIRICDWLLKTQDENGGWAVDRMMNLREGLRYSAMPQGEATSVLVRAWRLTNKTDYLEAADSSYHLITRSITNGGTAHVMNDDIFLEEYPSMDKNTILNGWIFALFGIYDYFLATGDNEAKTLFYRSYDTLKGNLDKYDAGYWSFYDEKGSMIASPFYHRLHISQLEALSLVVLDNGLKAYIARWKGYDGNPIKKGKAFFMKARQKLNSPGDVIVVG